ncbi:PQQ-binding-like beta-propeller repeat protein [Actomonas aquatica]|uniref:PQQ-binding-like beta-propeller repeat protein n=1 Tax=Actomonas aquatica TaxID=2866162 RepID=A0ABZ1C6L4_9BACT|nr:PQQ-binding-like beta-propeller repeat protein [Opitutus sp. WL0086]WRQ87047.1 PQQ-binding-like beta-propeller repeat protein [Opitutus sp. WL0086]
MKVRKVGAMVLSLIWGGLGLQAQTDGTLLWSYTTLSSAAGGAILSAPAVDGEGTVYFGLEIGSSSALVTGGRVLALRPDGSVKWQTNLPDWVDASPLVGRDGETLYVGCWDGEFYALDRATGAVKWSYDTEAFIGATAAQGPDGTLYVPGGDGLLHAISETGAVQWVFPATDWIQAAPTVAADGVVYFGSWDDSFYAVNPDGSLLWQAVTGGDVVGAAAVAADGTVIFGSRDRYVYALNLDGSAKWSLETGDSVEASPVIGADGTIFIGSSDGVMRAIRPDGSVKWTRDVGAEIYATAAVRADGSVVVGASDYQVHAWSADGTPLWTVEAGDWLDSSPVVTADGRIYVGSYDKKLYAIHGTVGPALSGDWPQFQRTAQRGGWQPRGSTTEATGRLQNLSVRTNAGSGAQTLVAGFVVAGEGQRSILLRGVGPTLAQSYGLTTALSDTQLKVYDPSGAQVAVNDDWDTESANETAVADTAAELGAFPLVAGAGDAAVVASFGAGSNSVHVTGVDGETGLALVEAYDAGGDADTRLVNVSARSQVGMGADVLIAGFVIDETMTLLVRGVGPALTGFQVAGAITDPLVEIHGAAGVVAQVDDWAVASDAALIAAEAATVGAFALPANGRDAAMIITLPAGVYSAVVKGANGETGVGLVEVYVLAP